MERPAEANDRSQFGHYECDLLCFSRQRGVVLQIVERKTKFGAAARVPSKNADAAAEALSSILDGLKAENTLAVRSVTFDNGKEFAMHATVAEHASIKTFFCHPYSAFERGTVENANGVVRRYLPRSADLSGLEQDELSDIRAEMNNRPMKVLGWLTPAEAFRKELLKLSHTQSAALHP
jgi:IS30 family transposase